MNYYIQGDAAKADQIKAAFERNGIDTSANSNYGISNLFYYSYNGEVAVTQNRSIINIIKTHPDYKELELPVEPKFKVGDWYLCTKDFLGKGVRFDKGKTYHCGKDDCLQQFDKGAHVAIVPQLYNHFKLWSIADAKGGDVLVYQDEIFLVESVGNYSVLYHCCFDGELVVHSFYAFSKEDLLHVHPATKEQRDLLFTKMKEAGYEWDADKKELRKIKPHYDIANFKPFDKVLTRDTEGGNWNVNLFSYYIDNEDVRIIARFRCMNSLWHQCIPFNEYTKHLLGTTDMCDEQYINW